MVGGDNLKAGEAVWHPEKKHGVTVETDDGIAVKYAHGILGFSCQTHDLDGWKRVEVVQPGCVQVRVDDLDLSTVPTDEQPCDSVEDLLAVRAARAVAMRASKSKPKPTKSEPTEFGAMVTFTFDDERGELSFLRVSSGSGRVWLSDHAERRTWEELIEHDGIDGTLTIKRTHS